MIRRAALLSVLAATACLGPRPDASTFYVLSSMASPAAQVSPLDVTLGVGPVVIPDYLDRSELVTRLSEHQLALSPTARWAEPLDVGVVRVLHSNLARLLQPDEIVGFPWYASQAVTYGIAIEFTRLEADASGAVEVDAAWTIASGDHEEVFDRGEATLREPGGGVTTEASVAALSRALEALAARISAQLRDLHRAR